jgi:hypothetical protein
MQAIKEMEQLLSAGVPSLQLLEEGFLNNEVYAELPQNKRVAFLVDRYRTVLNLMIGDGSHSRFLRNIRMPLNKPEPRIKTRVTRTLRNVQAMERQTQPTFSSAQPLPARKLRRKLFEDPDAQFEQVTMPDGRRGQRSKCPGFCNVVFTGNQVLRATRWGSATARQRKPVPAVPMPTITSEGAAKVAPEASQPVGDLETAVQQMVDDSEIESNLKRRILMILEKIVSHYLLDDLAKTTEFSLTKFVDTGSENEAAEEAAPEPKREPTTPGEAPAQKPQKSGVFKRRVERPLNLRDDRRQGFARDLALAIIEGERYMRPYAMRYYDSAAGQSALDDITFIRSKVKEKVEPIVQTVVFPDPEELTVNGRAKRLPPKKVKPMCEPQRPRSAISQPPTLSVGLGGGRDASLLGKRRPRPTKFEPVEPEPPGAFFIGEPGERQEAKEVPAVHPKWRPPEHQTVTGADVDMFLFIAPFVAPPQAIAEMIRDAERAL